MTDLPPAGTLRWLDAYTDMGGRILAEIGCTPEQIAAFGGAWEERCWPMLAEAVVVACGEATT